MGMFGKLTGNVLFLLPLVWIGFDLRMMLAALSLNLAYPFWIHATWVPQLGWLEYVLNTPLAHRVHHAANLEYLDANYGSVLIVFDRLFGTYIEERDDVPCRHGLVHAMTSHQNQATTWSSPICMAGSSSPSTCCASRGRCRTSSAHPRSAGCPTSSAWPRRRRCSRPPGC